jgi:hypothetical protein
MVTVYVWKHYLSHMSVGHAAMEVDGGVPQGSAYLSWWPSGGNIVEKVYLSTTPTVHQNLQEDIAKERRQPDCVIRIEGLDESKIKAYWRSWWPHGRYSGLNLSCATTVGNALMVGGGTRFTTGWVHKQHWTPEDCALLASQIKGKSEAHGPR